jgi:hypothetical protein
VTDPGPPATADPHAALRAELGARWNNRVPPHITTEVARREFDHFLAKYPHAVPEIIAIALIRRVDQWDELTAIQSVLHAVLTPSTTTEEGTRRG